MTLATFRSLADFKRALAVQGAIVRVLVNEYRAKNNHTEDARAKYEAYMAVASAGRTIAKLQTNAIKYSDGSWHYFGKAVNWEFDGGAEATCRMGDGSPDRIVYTVEHPASPEAQS